MTTNAVCIWFKKIICLVPATYPQVCPSFTDKWYDNLTFKLPGTTGKRWFTIAPMHKCSLFQQKKGILLLRPRCWARGSSAEQGWVGRPDPPGAPGSPGPPRPGPHLRGMVPGAGLRRAQLCRTNRLRMPLLGPHSSCPALEKPFRKSYLHLPRPKLQGRGRPQSLKTLHRIAKGSSAWTQ